MRDRHLLMVAALTAVCLHVGRAHAEAPPAPAAEAAPEAETAPAAEVTASPAVEATPAPAPAAPRPAPPPYTQPWQLRPAAVTTALRLDTAWARYADDGATVVGFVSGSYKLAPRFAPFVRLGTVADAPPAGADGGAVFVNPALGLTWMVHAAPGHRVTATFATTLPVGMGGGNTPDMSASATEKAGLWARSGMDNAMFAVNDLGLIAGSDGALMFGKLTLQAEVTLFQLFRVRGADAQADKTKTNLTSGVAAGWSFAPWLSASTELRYQRYLSTPVLVDKDGSYRESLSVAVGVRTSFALAEGIVSKPGVALVRGLDDPLDSRGYTTLLLDLPVVFP